MPVSEDQRNSPFATANLKFLKQKHKSQLQGVENLKLNPAPQTDNEVGRKVQDGAEPLHRIYPREMYVDALHVEATLTRLSLTEEPRTKSKKKSKPQNSSPAHAVTSPVLSAVGAATATQYASDWASSLPTFLGHDQKHNTSTSPPANPRGGSVASTRIPSNSPPSIRPSSYTNQHLTFGGRHRVTGKNLEERISPYSPYGSSPYGGHVPRPHEDQSHFYAGGLPDLDSLVPLPQNGLVPGENGFYVGFDSLSASGHWPSTSSENILFVGEEGALRIYRISRKAVDIIGRLEGLSGAVIGAKIIPSTFNSDLDSSERPYVALVLHSPILTEDDAAESSDASAANSIDGNDTSPEPSTVPTSGHARSQPFVLRQYQTTVEIFSLSRRHHIGTIFKCPPVDVTYTESGEIRAPPPSGHLKVDAQGKFLTIASGLSGEIFVFSHFHDNVASRDTHSFRCIGKLWTSTIVREIKPPSNSADKPSSIQKEERLPQRVALYSLSNRWLAVVTPAAESLFTMKGVASLASPDHKPPGISSHSPGSKLATSCAIDTPETDSLVDRVSREVAQQVMKGAHWAAEHGMQAWNSYWYGNQHGELVSSTARASGFNTAFPPTHGIALSPPSHNSPNQVAIFDLQRLLDAEISRVKNALLPIASFEPPTGCSFLSFAPSGLMLLTVNSKGDQQIVWSLLRAQQPRTNLTNDDAVSPSVRQMAKFTRVTVSSIVDVVWNAPQGNRFSILTERGTIHVQEIPTAAFHWPPLKRSKRRVRSSSSQSGDHDDSSRQSALSTAFSTINGTGAWMRTLPVRPRSIGPATLMLTPAATASAGGKVVKAGFNKSVSMVANSANTIYHASENKLHIGNLSNGLFPGAMRWLSGRDQEHFAVVVTGTLSIYNVHQTSTTQKGKPPIVRAKISKRPVEFNLHRISDSRFPPAYRDAVHRRIQGASEKKSVTYGGYWSLRSPVRNAAMISEASVPDKIRAANSWHAMFETESNAPFQPFHTDRRVAIYAYPEFESQAPPMPLETNAEPEDYDTYNEALVAWQHRTLEPWLQKTHHVLPRETDKPKSACQPWVFGDEIAADKVFNGGSGVVTGDVFNDDDEMENKIHVIEGVDGEQVHVTVVRRAGREEEDFFEDGCEVVEFADERS